MIQSKLVRARTHVSLLAVSVGLALSACASNSNDAAKAKDAGAQDGAKTEAKADAGDQPIAGTPVEGDQNVAVKEGGAGQGAGDQPYALKIEPPEAKVGEQGQVSIKVIPSADWHMNLEYPTKLTVTAPAGVDVPKPKLSKDDAVKLDAQNCEFAVAFTPSEAGEKTFTGEFKFAVCQDTACVPKTEKLEFKVAVK